MDCPACPGFAMREIDLHHVKVDRCGRCGGMWFDEGELRGVLAVDEALLGIFNLDLLGDLMKAQGRLSDRRGPGGNPLVTITCPDTKVEVEVDPATGGVFLDRGELAAVREQLAERIQTMDLPTGMLRLGEEAVEAVKPGAEDRRREIREVILLAAFLWNRLGVAMQEKHPALMNIFRQLGVSL